jgi:hypothetical protein
VRYKENREREQAKGRAYRQANKGKFAAYTMARKQFVRQATPWWVDKKAIQRVYDLAAEQGLSVDHIHPLRGENFCGLHVPWNLQLLTLSENSRKGNRLAAL